MLLLYFHHISCLSQINLLSSRTNKRATIARPEQIARANHAAEYEENISTIYPKNTGPKVKPARLITTIMLVTTPTNLGPANSDARVRLIPPQLKAVIPLHGAARN